MFPKPISEHLILTEGILKPPSNSMLCMLIVLHTITIGLTTQKGLVYIQAPKLPNSKWAVPT